MGKVLSFGAIVWDIIEGVPYVGGAPFNLAAHAAKCGIPSFMLTCLGRDEFGRRSLAEMKRLGVGQRYVQFDPEHPTATVVVSLSETGQPSYDIKDEVNCACGNIKHLAGISKNLRILGGNCSETNSPARYRRHFCPPIAGCDLSIRHGNSRSSNESRPSSGSPLPISPSFSAQRAKQLRPVSD
jgi:hypothetical protein